MAGAVAEAGALAGFQRFIAEIVKMDVAGGDLQTLVVILQRRQGIAAGVGDGAFLVPRLG